MPVRRGGVDSKAVAMMRGLSIRKRLERLEAVHKKQANVVGREAFIEMGAFDGERHLVMMSPRDQARCYFQEMPGPGPQLADFGEFSLVLVLTSAEMNF
jgi:hypothetical protein